MDRLRPKYVTFDCHGTLINFQMAEAARDLFGRLLDGPRMDEFIKSFSAYRLEEITHVSSSFRYDLMSAYDLGIKNKVWVNRRHEPANPYYEYSEIPDVTQLPGVFGL
jgi:FMN phosphatase YigB (HAD superfamily)